MIDAARSPIDEWGPASIVDGLGANEAHVWRASLDQPADVISKLAPLLSHDECQRAMRYYRPVDRDRFIVGGAVGDVWTEPRIRLYGGIDCRVTANYAEAAAPE